LPLNNLDHVVASVRGIIEGETDMIAAMANAAAIVYHGMQGVNWVGFYIMRNGELVLGPFQGLPACVRIRVGRGVCGTAAAERRTVVVDDVHSFEGHIACDSASNSEVVVPLVVSGEVVAVLDVDSPHHARFTADDVQAMERVAAMVAGVVQGQ